MADRVDVFISSTSKDLTKYRERVIQALRKLGVDCIAMEEFTPSERNALQVCYDELCEADYFVGIYAYRYGYAPDETVTYKTEKGELRSGDGITGITHWEYQWAVERGLPLFLFIVDSANDDETLRTHGDVDSAKSRFDAFKLQIGHDHVIGFFKNPDDLASQAVAAVGSYIIERPGRPKRSDSYQHIALPDNYVPRSDLLAELRLSLLGDTDSVALTSGIKAAPTALHGMGGIGKSVMARALCDDPAVQAAFPDGILWTTLGQEPNLVTKLREWVTALGGSIPENAPTEDSLKANLAGLLENRACLLVVDDVWQRKHAEAFRVGGLKCRLLLTTRDAEIARAMNADVQSIPVMAEPEAVELLAEWGKEGLQEADDALKRQIVNRVGRLPLAVKLAGAQLQRKAPQEWLKTFDVRKVKSKRIENVHDSLELTFGLSLDALGQQERKLYAALVIFKEDEPVREVAIQRLWSALGHLDEDEVGDLVDDLGARALMDVVGGQYPRAVILHDLLRDFMASELGDPVATHQSLLDSYAQTRTGEGWHTANDDGYLYDHLVFHLVAAKHESDLPDLFATDEWMRARFDQSYYTYDGFIRDVTVAWELAHTEAERQIEAGEGADELAQSVHYALIRTSINSLAENYVPALVARAVETGLWSFQRGLSVAYNVSFVQQKAILYTALLRTDKGEKALRDEALILGLEAAAKLDYEHSRIIALARLAGYLDVEQKRRVLESGLEATQEFNSYAQSLIFIALAGQLSGELLERGLRVALAMENEISRAEALAALVEQLSGELLERSLEAAMVIESAAPRAKALAALAGRLSGEQREKILELGLKALLTIEDEDDRVKASVALAGQLSGEQREKVLEQGLEIALAIEDESSRADALAALAGQLSGNLLERSLEATLTIEDEDDRVKVLAALAGQLSGEQREKVLEQGLEIAFAYVEESSRMDALTALAGQLSGKLLERCLDAALAIEDNDKRVNVLGSLVGQLSGVQREKVLDKSLEAIDEIKYAHFHTKALSALTRQLNGEQKFQMLQYGLEVVLAVEDQFYRAAALEAFAAQLSGELLEQGLEIALAIEYERGRAEVLEALAGQLNGELLERSLEAALVIESDEPRVRVLARLAEQLSGERKEKILEIGLESALAIDDESSRAKALAALAGQLSGKSLEKALETTLAIKYEQGRVEVLEALARQLSGELLERGLDAVHAIEDAGRCAKVVAALAGQLSGERKEKILEIGLEFALAEEHEYARAEALVALTGQLNGELLERSLEAALAIEYETARAKVFESLIPHLSIRQNQHIIALNLLRLNTQRRGAVLEFCACENLLATPIFTQAALERIAQSIIDICWNWRWQ